MRGSLLDIMRRIFFRNAVAARTAARRITEPSKGIHVPEGLPGQLNRSVYSNDAGFHFRPNRLR